MKHIHKECKKTITLADLNYLTMSMYIGCKYIVELPSSFKLEFNNMKVFQKPDLIYFRGDRGRYFCIKENEIRLIERLADKILVHINNGCDDKAITIIPYTTR